MYLAEIHGKLSRENENKEDILTSNVFSFFKYSDRKTFFHPLLQLLGLVVDPEEAKNAVFTFWPSFEDGTEPDLVICAGKYYLLIEAKYHSGFGQKTKEHEHQLIREVKSGADAAATDGLIFIIVTVTSDHFPRPEDFKEYPKEFRDNLRWINWQTIALLIYQIIQGHPQISNETLLFAEDLYDLFLKKDLRNFEGVQVLETIPLIKPPEGAIFLQTSISRYTRNFTGFTQVPMINQKMKPLLSNEPIFYSWKIIKGE